MESRIKKLLKRSYHDKTEIMFESDTNSEVAKECGFVSAIYENGNMETQSITYFREMIKKRNKYALECTMKTLRAFKIYPEIFAHEVEWQQFSNLLCKSE